jgi:nucleotidyltransferase-like protein
MHIYAFGSLCRGDIDRYSDVDLLAIVDSYDPRFDVGKFSVYSYARISDLWREGNPFAWHLHLEAQLLYANNGEDYIRQLGAPLAYSNCAADCEKFFELYREACESLVGGSSSIVFDLGTIFLSIRNFATCYSLSYAALPTFSRRSALELEEDSLEISEQVFSVIERARILSTRGIGDNIAKPELFAVFTEFKRIENWMVTLLGKVKKNE